MPTELIAVLAIVVFLGLILTEIPVALAVMFSGLMGTVLLVGTDKAALVLRATPYSATASFTLVVIPMYVLLGALVSNAGIGAAIYRVMNRIVGRLPGGLAATCVLSTAVFSGISGSTAADVATFGRISVTEMRRHGYEPSYAAAVVAAAGAFAFLIPPSITLVIYGILADVHIGGLILAGFVPGIFSALVLGVYVVIKAKIGKPGYGRPPAKELSGATAASQSEGNADAESGADSGAAPGVGNARIAAAAATAMGLNISQAVTTPARVGPWNDVLALFYAVILFAVVIGGLYAGVFTATEAGALGAFVALIIAVLARPFHEGSLRQVLVTSLRETTDVTSMIFLLLIGGAVFGFMTAMSGLPSGAVQWSLNLPISPLLLVALFLVLLIPLGMFLDGLTIMVLTVPIVAPVIKGLGFDGIWFGILFAKLIEIGLITPPVGLNVYVIAGIMKIPAENVFRHVFPFVVLDLIVTAILFAFPDIIMWLPRLSGLD